MCVKSLVKLLIEPYATCIFFVSMVLSAMYTHELGAEYKATYLRSCTHWKSICYAIYAYIWTYISLQKEIPVWVDYVNRLEIFFAMEYIIAKKASSILQILPMNILHQVVH